MAEKGVEEQVLAMERLRFNPERNNNLGFYTSLQRISMKRNIPRDFLLIKNGCRVVSPAATVLIIIGLHNSAPMQESAYGPDKTHNSYTGKLSYGSPAVHDTARSEAVKAMQVPAGRVQDPSQKDGWDTSDLPAALR